LQYNTEEVKDMPTIETGIGMGRVASGGIDGQLEAGYEWRRAL
jgi:hypothetical protein